MKQMEMFPFSLDELQTEQSKFQVICPWVISGGKRVKLKGILSWKYGIVLGGRWGPGSELVHVASPPSASVSPACESRLSWPVACVGTSVLSIRDTWGQWELWDRELYSCSLSLPVTTLEAPTLFLHIVKVSMLFIDGVD